MGELYFGWVSILRDDECSHGCSSPRKPALEKSESNRPETTAARADVKRLTSTTVVTLNNLWNFVAQGIHRCWPVEPSRLYRILGHTVICFSLVLSGKAAVGTAGGFSRIIPSFSRTGFHCYGVRRAKMMPCEQAMDEMWTWDARKIHIRARIPSGILLQGPVRVPD